MDPKLDTKTTNITSIAMVTYVTVGIVYFTSCLFVDWSVKTYILGFLACAFTIQFIMNLWATSLLCQIDSTRKPDILKAFLYTFSPWILILCIISGILYIMPGWARVFSNTIGSSISKSIYQDLFTLTKSENEKEDIANHIYNDPSKIINEIGYVSTIEDFLRIYNTFLIDIPYFKNPLFHPTEKNPLYENIGKDNEKLNKSHLLYQLFRCVAIKEKIGYFVWLFLTGMIFVLVSLSQIYESDC